MFLYKQGFHWLIRLLLAQFSENENHHLLSSKARSRSDQNNQQRL